MADRLPQQLGARIQILRKRAGMTQEELAESVGLAPNYVSEIERGAKTPTLETLSSVVGALGVSLSEALLGVGDKESERKRIERLESALAGRSTQQRDKIMKVVEAALAVVDDAVDQ